MDPRDPRPWDHLSASPYIKERLGGALGIGENIRSFRTLRKLILPSVQVNMRAGEFPPAEDDGQADLKIPLNKF
jgi:hypothetical protein